MSVLRSAVAQSARVWLFQKTAPTLSSAMWARAFSSSVTCNKAQSASPLGPMGVEAALRAASDPSFIPRATMSKEFDLTGRVVIVSGGNRGLGLEMAEAMCESGAIVYCIDLPDSPSDEWKATQKYVQRLSILSARLEYVKADVTNQHLIWRAVEEIADKEGRMDVCIAAAGILDDHECLEYPASDFSRVMNVNVNGVLYTAQAASRQMVKRSTPGSIILIASMSGSITNKDHTWIAYNTSKSAVLQMGRSLACELGPKRIRVNTLSPGHIYTAMTATYLDPQPELFEKLSKSNPLGRLGRPDELRGVITWLASDASTFCTGSDILVSGGHHAW